MMQPGSSRSASMKILFAIDAGRRRDGAVGPRRQQRGAPPEEPRGHRHRRACVSEVVLAVAERSLAVLPSLAPMDGCQRDEHDVRSSAARALPRAFVEDAAQFDGVSDPAA